MSKRVKSGIIIARFLGTEGLTPHVSTLVKRYAKRRWSKSKYQRWRRLKAAFSEMVKAKLSEGDKAILGKMIAELMGMHLTTGLRIGLGVRLLDEPPLEFDDDGVPERTEENHKRIWGSEELC